MLLHLAMTALAVAFALSCIEIVGAQDYVHGPWRVLLGLAVAAGSLAALEDPAFLVALVAAPATTYCGAAMHMLVEFSANRTAVVEPRRRFPRL